MFDQIQKPKIGNRIVPSFSSLPEHDENKVSQNDENKFHREYEPARPSSALKETDGLLPKELDNERRTHGISAHGIVLKYFDSRPG